MYDKKEKILSFCESKRCKSINIQTYLSYVDKDVRRLIKLITNYLYLGAEKRHIENVLFFSKVLYPMILYYYNSDNRVDSVEKVISDLECRKTGHKLSDDIGLTVTVFNKGCFLISDIKNLFINTYDKKEDGTSAMDDVKTMLYYISPDSPDNPDFVAFSDENKVLFEMIGKGYDNFMDRVVKITSQQDGYNFIKADEMLDKIEERLFSIIGKKSFTNEYLTTTHKRLTALESQFIRYNNLDGIHRARLYINLVNRYLIK